MMSSERHVTWLGVETRLGTRSGLRTHVHPFHQLTWAPGGSVCIGADGASWLVSRSVGLWVPAGVAHDVMATRTSVMRSVYFSPDACPLPWTVSTPVGALGLVGHLLDHLIETPVSERRRRVEQVLFDLLVPVPAVAVRLPRLVDDRARRVADALAADPADNRTLDEWGRFVGASGRTLARVIRAEAGMGFAEWRTQMRITHAAQRLAEGARVGRVARDVGYATPSAFVAAFRRVVGTAPGAYASASTGRHRAAPADGIPVTTVPPHSVVDLVTTSA